VPSHQWSDDVYAGFTADRNGDHLNVMLSRESANTSYVIVELLVP